MFVYDSLAFGVSKRRVMDLVFDGVAKVAREKHRRSEGQMGGENLMTGDEKTRG